MKRLPILLTFMCSILGIYAQSDVENSKDYPLLPRMPDYLINKYTTSEFDSHEFFIDRKKQSKEGRKFRIYYRHNRSNEDGFEFPTRLQILRNYSQAIEKAGGSVIFERHNAEYGQYNFTNSEQKEIWVEIKPSASGKNYVINIIEKDVMRQDIVIDAELIKTKIDIEGKIAIYGIYFDLGKAKVKEESESALVQISTYLKDNPTVNCWIVGHTDASGSFKTNSELSLERAIAVKRHLVQQFKIASDRLYAEGVGPLAPIATNATEEGKAANRRVELVKK